MEMENTPPYLSKTTELDWKSQLQSHHSRRRTRCINDILIKEKSSQLGLNDFSFNTLFNSPGILLKGSYSYTSSVLSDLSPSPTSSSDENFLTMNLMDTVNKVFKKRSQSVPALLRIDIYQDRAMRLMRKRHGKIFEKRKVLDDDTFNSFDNSPNDMQEFSLSSPQDFAFTFDYNEINKLNKELLSMDNNIEESLSAEKFPESPERVLFFTDSENNNIFHITPSMVKSFEIQREIRHKRRKNKGTHSFDDTCLHRESC
ncbi:uncharacterized protein LOC128247804 [Octopus bimaculoides]|uniref:uncharacterized protein LOC128247804 n=1 Tax=Octopus bimaculoides TaxID=37653 RepID=UPI0022E6B6E8|nr:uncharacterized protein LOC128247804 [Octopus bimaculoides]